jgi:hypothetical protein
MSIHELSKVLASSVMACVAGLRPSLLRQGRSRATPPRPPATARPGAFALLAGHIHHGEP